MKIGIILTSHGNLSSGLLSSIEMVMGVYDDIVVVDFLREDDYKKLDDLYINAYKRLRNCDYILLMADIAGGTPFNRAYLSLSDKKNVRFLVGVNFNMLYCALTGSEDHDDIDIFLEEIIDKTRDSIIEYK